MFGEKAGVVSFELSLVCEREASNTGNKTLQAEWQRGSAAPCGHMWGWHRHSADWPAGGAVTESSLDAF